MWGVELADPVDGRPGRLAEQIQARCLAEGLIVELGGRDDRVVRLLPPLNVVAEVVDVACSILVDAIRHSVPGRTALPLAATAGPR